MSLWCNENAGPDGADGGNGGHVVFQACYDVNNFAHVPSILKATDGDKGGNKDCHGKNAQHLMVKVPVGTIVKNNLGRVVGDMDREGLMFVAARGGAGGKGNHFFITDADQAPKVCEIGAAGEDLSYVIELRSMAHVGLVRAYCVYNEMINLIGGKKSLIDWPSECWQKYVTSSNNTGQTKGCAVRFHHLKTTFRHR